MKKSYIFFLIITIIISGILFNYKIGFGEESDPLVTQSYVEMRIEQVIEYFEQKMKKTNQENNPESLDEIGKYIRFIPLELKIGNKLIGGEGTEIVLRSGEARGVGSNNGGLLDVTDGIDINDNQDIPKHHLIIVPRNDERGIRIISTDAYVMVKGPYEIK